MTKPDMRTQIANSCSGDWPLPLIAAPRHDGAERSVHTCRRLTKKPGEHCRWKFKLACALDRTGPIQRANRPTIQNPWEMNVPPCHCGFYGNDSKPSLDVLSSRREIHVVFFLLLSLSRRLQESRKKLEWLSPLATRLLPTRIRGIFNMRVRIKMATARSEKSHR